MQVGIFFWIAALIIGWGIFQFFVVLFMNPAAELVELAIVSGFEKIKK